ncbi:pyridoxamine 5'-phosphate oxidase family protein [Mycobacterium paraterrae]|uniref:Pyridoxamine 5'-phosphate oxidase family protein n=1 Tax=Mycobacterium paraterrae TaxID=577492 RepID=A0ABY3VN74_9MYCO|nr:pyridoxamine 5'-phosphate oxidase family protein [Mycobacterium paraterrae]UMB70891.1 pyridoxamine 5'-phosphate oxidase family protein [Mycobacterium paraterrae]
MSVHTLNPSQREQWIELIRKASVGRLIFTELALPAVQLVEFCCWRDDVVVRVTDAPVLAAVSRNQVLAFEADEFDADLESGWSVTVVGHSAPVTKVPELIELSGMFSRPSAGGRWDYFVRIRCERVCGRRFG